MAYIGQPLIAPSLPVSIPQGGTGASTSAAARTNLSVPSIAEIQNATPITLSVTGTDTIVATVTPAITSYSNGQTFRFTAVGDNTGAVTINISGLGAKSITKSGATALTAGDIKSGSVVQITYDGTQFQLLAGAGGGTGTVADGTMLETGTVVSNNYTVPAGKNALGVDKISVATGKTVSIPSGSKLIVVGGGGQSGTPDQYVGVSGNQTITGAKNFTVAPTLNGSDLTSIGIGQTWQNVTGSRAAGVNYTNTTGRPIFVAVNVANSGTSGSFGASMTIGGVTIYQVGTQSIGTGNMNAGITAIVPPNVVYSISLISSTLDTWRELR